MVGMGQNAPQDCGFRVTVTLNHRGRKFLSELFVQLSPCQGACRRLPGRSRWHHAITLALSWAAARARFI